jgi:DNA-binding CsgD family transcriptional regulator/tetratricopeptide (TPR) repeat protein
VTTGAEPAVREGSFVGRDGERALVRRALEAARGSTPQVVVIEGEPGIGKTAFLRHCLSEAEDAVVLQASGDESETALDLGVVGQLLAQARAGSDHLPGRQPPAGASPSAAFTNGTELLEVLGSLQDSGPVVVALDDVQWIDPASAAALLFAVRRLYVDRVCVLLATRPDGLPRDGTSWSRLLHDDQRTQRVTLTGLDGHEVAQLAGSMGYPQLSAGAAERLREHTGGHPLHLKALLAELPREALTRDSGPLPAPRSFAATVLARLTGVSSEAQDLVAAVAVAGDRSAPKLAGAAAGLEDPLAAVEEALEADLLALTPARVPAEVAFPHPLVRAAVYDDLSLTRRRGLHLAFAALTAGSVSLAHRVAASTGGDDALALELAEAGEADVAAGRLSEGIEHLLVASRVAASEPAREAGLLRAVDLLGIAGDVPRALGLRAEVASCRDSARRSFILATLTASGGRLAEAVAALRQVIERPDFRAHPELYGPVTSSLAIVCAYAGAGADAIVWARAALADEQAQPTVQVTATQALAIGFSITGLGREGVAVLESLSSARVAPAPFEAELLATRGNLKVWSGDLPGAVEDLSAVIRWSRGGAGPRSLPNAYSSLAEAEYRLGRWQEGPSHADLAVTLARESDQLWELPLAHAVASFFHASRGDWGLAEEHVEAAHRAVQAAPLPLGVYYAWMATAHLASVRGDGHATLEALGKLREKTPPGMAATLAQGTWAIETEALVRTGRTREAAATLDAHSLDRGDVAAVDGARLRGTLEHATGHPDKARRAFIQGQHAARVAQSPLAQAALELEHGRFLRRSSRRSAATERLRVARGLFEQLGARPFIERCDTELAACGVRAQSATDDGYGLTPREQVVAGLVASGKTNREVGAELFLSTKAIEYHLAHIFAKVGVRSRHQLASRLRGSDEPA